MTAKKNESAAAKNYGTRALSISQPWAWAITDLSKRVENRSKANKKEGPGGLWIHTGAKEDKPGLSMLYDMLSNKEAALLDSAICAGKLARGCVVAYCHMDPCTSLEEYQAANPDSDWAFGRFCYPLSSVQKLREPVPFKGKLGFWTLPDKVVAACAKQLAPMRVDDLPPGEPGKVVEGSSVPDFEGEPESNRKPAEIKGDGRLHGAKPGVALTPMQVDALGQALDTISDLTTAMAPLERALQQATEKGDKAKKAIAAIKADRKKLFEHLVAIRSGQWQTRLPLGD